MIHFQLERKAIPVYHQWFQEKFNVIHLNLYGGDQWLSVSLSRISSRKSTCDRKTCITHCLSLMKPSIFAQSMHLLICRKLIFNRQQGIHQLQNLRYKIWRKVAPDGLIVGHLCSVFKITNQCLSFRPGIVSLNRRAFSLSYILKNKIYPRRMKCAVSS